MRSAAGLLFVLVLLNPGWGGGWWAPRARPVVVEGGMWIAAPDLAPVVTTTVYMPSILRVIPPPLDLGVSRVEVIQGTTMSDAYTVHVANRPAFVRAFVTLTTTDGSTSRSGVRARLTRYVGGVAQDALIAGPVTIYATTDEGNLNQTLNFNLPTTWLAVGASYVLELDYDNSIPEANESNNRYPATGQQSFNFVAADLLTVMVVPVSYEGTLPTTTDLSYLTWMPIKVYPISQATYQLHGTHLFTGDLSDLSGSGWVDLLFEIDGIHIAEDPSDTKIYYGLVNSVGADGCSGGCIAGIGFIGFPSSVGFSGFSAGDNAASPVATHEMGHNFGRYHANCGGPAGVDLGYPYGSPGDATIGQWGHDTATGLLYNPSTYDDYMSYCDPTWTSDYTYKNIYDFRLGSAFRPQSLQDSLYVSGWTDLQGNVQLRPVSRQLAPVEGETAGTHRVELLGADGAVLTSRSFNPVTIAVDTRQAGASSGFEVQGFRVVLPAVDGLAAIHVYEGDRLLFERAVSGPAPVLVQADSAQQSTEGATVSWQLTSGSSVTYRVRFSPDGGRTWKVLALRHLTTSINIPTSLLGAAAQRVVEVQAQDGVRTSTLLIPLAPTGPHAGR